MILESLLKMDGVVAAGEFSGEGKLLRYKTKIGMLPEMKKMSAEFCSTITMMFTTMSDALTQVSHLKLVPQHGWAYSGGDWVVVVGGHFAVYAETGKADVGSLLKTLATIADERAPHKQVTGFHALPHVS